MEFVGLDRVARAIGGTNRKGDWRLGREVMACDSISINLFKLLVAALELNAPRKRS